jgi:hypothetical protein
LVAKGEIALKLQLIMFVVIPELTLTKYNDRYSSERLGKGNTILADIMHEHMNGWMH